MGEGAGLGLGDGVGVGVGVGSYRMTKAILVAATLLWSPSTTTP